MAPKKNAPASVPLDQLDSDIKDMKRADLAAELRLLKGKGVDTRTSGSVPDLKQYLHAARRDPVAAAAAAATTPASGAGTASGTDTPTQALSSRKGKVEDVLLPYQGVHPTTKDCLEKLGDVQHDISDEGMMGDDELATEMELLLKPASELVNAVITAKEDITERELSSSHTLNLQGLAKLVRGSLGGPVHVHAALIPLYRVFEVVVVALEDGQVEQAPLSQQEQKQQEADEARMADMSAMDRDVQRRYEQDLQESSQSESQTSNPSASRRAPASPSEPAGPDSAAADELDSKLKKEVAHIEQGLRFYLTAWMSTFPSPEDRKYPLHFDAKERDDLRSAVKKCADTLGINIAVKKMADADEAKVVAALLADDDFPVDDAKNEAIIKVVLKEQARVALEKEARRVKKAADDADGGDTSPDKTPKPTQGAKGQGKGGKKSGDKSRGARGRRGAPVIESEDDDGDGDGDEDEEVPPRPPTSRKRARDGEEGEDGGGEEVGARGTGGTGRKRTKTSDEPSDAGAGTEGQSEYGTTGKECATCFVAGEDCSLELRDKGDQCRFCEIQKVQCRIACDGCAALLNTSGRGCGTAEFLPMVCDRCDHRNLGR